jgi:CheY-like chemotaxis protein
MRVCVIDDDAMARDSLSICLADFGCEVITAENGDVALDLIASSSPDIVVTDLSMPGLSGSALVAALRARFPQMPIIAMSGNADATPDARAAARDANAFLHKPFGPRELLRLIAEVSGDGMRTP